MRTLVTIMPTRGKRIMTDSKIVMFSRNPSKMLASLKIPGIANSGRKKSK